MALDRALPKSYQLFDTLYDYPTTRVGLGASVSALLHVDGVTVSAPVMACAPAKVLENLTARGLGDFLEEVFSPVYGPQVAHEINATYQHYVPPEYGAYAVDADSASACGLRALAQAAAGSFQSPVYWSTVTAQPSHPEPLPTAAYEALWALLRGKNWQRAIQAAEKLLLEEGQTSWSK
eukprot:g28554.t1